MKAFTYQQSTSAADATLAVRPGAMFLAGGTTLSLDAIPAATAIARHDAV